MRLKNTPPPGSPLQPTGPRSAQAAGGQLSALQNALQSALQGIPSSAPADEVAVLRARVAELQRERDQLTAIVDILEEISSSLHFVDILQGIARKLGETFGLDRCAIFLSGQQDEVRLIASYEDPTIRNLVVDLNRYPELKRAFESGETVFIPDAASEPMLQGVQAALAMRNVRAIVVVPIRWEGAVIGAIFLRTLRSEQNAHPFSETDVRFCQTVASLTAKALRNAHRFESLVKSQSDVATAQRRNELQRIAMIGFLRRLLDAYGRDGEHALAETRLPDAASEEIQRMVRSVMQVVGEESEDGPLGR
jgi:two-component system, sensor histidine kinase ChiS